MNADLEYHLSQGPRTAKDLARLLGRSETWVRDALKKDIDLVKCKKNSTGSNVFWIGPDLDKPQDTPEPLPTTEVVQPQADEPQGEIAQDACPFCGSTEDQTPAGAEGTFLGSADTCSSCGKTYNRFSGKEVALVKDPKKRKAPLNPQYKITAKVEAMKAVGGSVRFDKADRLWIVEKANGDSATLTAQAFADLTPETIVQI